MRARLGRPPTQRSRAQHPAPSVVGAKPAPRWRRLPFGAQAAFGSASSRAGRAGAQVRTARPGRTRPDRNESIQRPPRRRAAWTPARAVWAVGGRICGDPVAAALLCRRRPAMADQCRRAARPCSPSRRTTVRSVINGLDRAHAEFGRLLHQPVHAFVGGHADGQVDRAGLSRSTPAHMPRCAPAPRSRPMRSMRPISRLADGPTAGAVEQHDRVAGLQAQHLHMTRRAVRQRGDGPRRCLSQGSDAGPRRTVFSAASAGRIRARPSTPTARSCPRSGRSGAAEGRRLA